MRAIEIDQAERRAFRAIKQKNVAALRKEDVRQFRETSQAWRWHVAPA